MKTTFHCAGICSCLLLPALLGVAALMPGDVNWDAGFNVPAGVNGDVTSVATLGGELYVAGHFTKAGNIEAKGLARWDGKNWFPVGGGVNGVIFAMTVV